MYLKLLEEKLMQVQSQIQFSFYLWGSWQHICDKCKKTKTLGQRLNMILKVVCKQSQKSICGFFIFRLRLWGEILAVCWEIDRKHRVELPIPIMSYLYHISLTYPDGCRWKEMKSSEPVGTLCASVKLGQWPGEGQQLSMRHQRSEITTFSPSFFSFWCH